MLTEIDEGIRMQRHKSWVLTWALVLYAICAWPLSVSAQELCGIDSIFADGFEGASFVPIAQIPGAIQSPGLTQDIVGSGSVSVIITAPTGSPTTADSTVDVAGTFVGPVNTGISVNGTSGATVNGAFLVPNVPLSAGANTLTVQALTLPGAMATALTSITQGGAAAPTAIAVEQAVGYAPLTARFHYTIGTLPGGHTVQSVAVNFRGTGPDDYTGPFSGIPGSFQYTQPGFYTAQFRVTDDASNTYTATRSVLIQDFAAQRGMVCDVYGYLKDRLNAQDATSAANAFQSIVSSSYATFFTALGSNMPATAQQLGVIIDGQMGLGFANMLIGRDNPDQTRSGYPIRITQGTDGVWRISEM